MQQILQTNKQIVANKCPTSLQQRSRITIGSEDIWIPFTSSIGFRDDCRRYIRYKPRVKSLRVQSWIPVLLFWILAMISLTERVVGGDLFPNPFPTNCCYISLPSHIKNKYKIVNSRKQMYSSIQAKNYILRDGRMHVVI